MTCFTDCADLGCFGRCDALELPILADLTGEYILKYIFLDSIQTKTFNATAGQPITLPSIFSELGKSTFQIVDPNGDLVVYNTKDCFKIELLLTFDL